MPGGAIEPPPEPADCTPAEASLCFTTRKFATTVSAGVTRTTATSTTERCATITGCNFEDAETTKDSDVCTIERRAAAATALPETNRMPELAIVPRSELLRRANPEPQWCKEHDGTDQIIIMKAPTNREHRAYVKGVLERRKEALSARGMNADYLEIRSETLGFTAFFYVYNLGKLGRNFFKRATPQVSTQTTWTQSLPLTSNTPGPLHLRFRPPSKSASQTRHDQDPR